MQLTGSLPEGSRKDIGCNLAFGLPGLVTLFFVGGWLGGAFAHCRLGARAVLRSAGRQRNFVQRLLKGELGTLSDMFSYTFLHVSCPTSTNILTLPNLHKHHAPEGSGRIPEAITEGNNFEKAWGSE